MNGSDITLTIGIFVIFVYLFAGIALSQGINHIKQNWPEYKCQPTIIPTASLFGHDTQKNFIECISSMGSLNFDLLTGPLQNLTSGMSSGMGGIASSMNSQRSMFGSMRGMFGGGMGGIFGMFNNIIVVLQQLAGTMTAVIYSIFGIIVTVFRMLQGIQVSLEGIWKGTPGDIIRTLA